MHCLSYMRQRYCRHIAKILVFTQCPQDGYERTIHTQLMSHLLNDKVRKSSADHLQRATERQAKAPPPIKIEFTVCFADHRDAIAQTQGLEENRHSLVHGACRDW